jgi:hypothetical protein
VGHTIIVDVDDEDRFWGIVSRTFERMVKSAPGGFKVPG